MFKLDFAGKEYQNCINECEAINSFVAKLGLGIVKLKKGNTAYFPKLDIAIEKSHIEIKNKLKVEV